MRYNKIVRMILLRVSDFVFEDQINEYLYPDDCLITFGDSDSLDRKVTTVE